ncbi:hypothetical protein [Roseicyclus persicicus]|uniref:Porin n=1 Tax=Roseicyclus persicicus TaxID=2650661 RepID=A0A7X6GXU8_9RHOB|nr:hypothetical protein [Roseibacterium persicicum]NKX44406.1 hypothetical protein [Roseibacterium persicicum]
MRRLILAATLALGATAAPAQDIPTPPGDWPAAGTFCGLFTLCPPPEPVTREAGR